VRPVHEQAEDHSVAELASQLTAEATQSLCAPALLFGMLNGLDRRFVCEQLEEEPANEIHPGTREHAERVRKTGRALAQASGAEPGEQEDHIDHEYHARLHRQEHEFHGCILPLVFSKTDEHTAYPLHIADQCPSISERPRPAESHIPAGLPRTTLDISAVAPGGT